jgi:hypothetical protein
MAAAQQPRTCPVSGVLDLVVDGKTNELVTPVEVKLAQNVADVVLHGPLRDVQLLTDLAVGMPSGHELEDLPLPLGERLGAGGCLGALSAVIRAGSRWPMAILSWVFPTLTDPVEVDVVLAVLRAVDEQLHRLGAGSVRDQTSRGQRSHERSSG